MAEPITKWPAFLSYYSKQNPGSSKQQASEAWSKYKETHGIVTGTTKKSSIRRESPKKSPNKGKQHATSPPRSGSKTARNSPEKSPPKTVMHALVQPNLTGIPRDIGTILATKLPNQAIASLQATTKVTKRFTQDELAKICQEQPTIGEMRAYFKELLVQPTWSVAFFDADSLRTNRLKLDIYWGKNGSYYHRPIEIYRHNVRYQFNTNRQTRSYAAIEKDLERIKTIIDPTSFKRILARRTNCDQSNYPNFLRQYMLNILGPFLLPFLDNVQIEDMFLRSISQTGNINVPQIPEVDPVPEELYLQGLKLEMVYLWIKAVEIDTNISIIPMTTIVDNIGDNISEIEVFIHTIGNQETTSYTTGDFVRYVKRVIAKKETIRFAFLSTKSRENVIKIAVEEYQIKNGVVTGTIYALKSNKSHKPSIAGAKPTVKGVDRTVEDLNRILRRKVVPGILDPLLAEKLLLENKIDVTGSRNIVHKQTTSTLRTLLHSATSISYTEIKYRIERNTLDSNGKDLIASILLLIAIWLGNPVNKKTASSRDNDIVIRAAITKIDQIILNL